MGNSTKNRQLKSVRSEPHMSTRKSVVPNTNERQTGSRPQSALSSYVAAAQSSARPHTALSSSRPQRFSRPQNMMKLELDANRPVTSSVRSNQLEQMRQESARSSRPVTANFMNHDGTPNLFEKSLYVRKRGKFLGVNATNKFGEYQPKTTGMFTQYMTNTSWPAYPC
jgi:hypothetical protein